MSVGDAVEEPLKTVGRMRQNNRLQGVTWYLGTIQYCVCLFGGGALWFLAALATGFFWGDLVVQVAACVLLLGLITVEAWWSHIPSRDSRAGEYIADFLGSAALAVMGMAVVLGILTWLPHPR